MPRLKDLTGHVFGRLIVLNRHFENLRNRPAWNCVCSCGNTILSASADLVSGDKNSCGCLRKDLLRIDLTGERFGNLIVKEMADKRGSSSSQFWKCLCDCGNISICSAQHLRENYVKSCGCIKEENIKNPESFKNEFFSNMQKTDDCWIWKGRKSKSYGIFFCEKMIQAHRFSFILHFGCIPKNKIICHKCDNPLCVNPAHLYAGTHKDNAQDRTQRGRGRKSKNKSLIVR